jgi:death-on-curing family protein
MGMEIFTLPDGNTEIEVHFEGETFWLTLNQIAILFEKDKSVISRHLKNIFLEGELKKDSTVAKNATVKVESNRRVKRELDYYSLDAILSVGYRVNSKRGTQFRQWATQRLRDYLKEGFLINHQRLVQKNIEIKILHDGIRILSRVIEQKANEVGSLHWLENFNTGLKLLYDYDHESLDAKGLHFADVEYPSLNDYKMIVNFLKKDSDSKIVGIEKDESFESAISQIRQGFDNNDIYPSIEEKAAMLLYLIVKNHAFIDGNKRIAAACFLMFLERNKLLFNESGLPIIGNESLAALTLFIASSNPAEMETVKRLIISFLNRHI